MSAWLKRFGLHLAAAVGATGVFVAAAAVGANQTRQQEQVVAVSSVAPARTRTPAVQRTPTPIGATATPVPAGQPASKPRGTPSSRPSPSPTPSSGRVAPERSLAGTVKDIQPDAIDVTGVGGREWHVVPAAGALIRLNGKAARLDQIQPGDKVVILGQAQPGPGLRFLAHAITAKRST